MRWIERVTVGMRSSLLALCALALFFGCSTTPPGQTGLMVIISTDLQPSEYDELEVQVSQETSPGGSWHLWMDRLSPVPAEITLPTTVLIQSGTSPDQDVLIRAILYDQGAPVVLREAQLQVPTDRLAELRLVLAATCRGMVATSGAEGDVVSTCPTAGESCQPGTGLCGSSVVSDVSQLPSYKPGDENLDAGSGQPSTMAEAGGSEAEAAPDSGDATMSVADAAQPYDGTSTEAAVETSTTNAPDEGADAPSCENACNSGTMQCSTGAIETCSVGADGCTHWTQTSTCGSNQSCVAGDAGVASCVCKSNACSQKGTICTGSETLGTCSEDANGCMFIASTTTCTTPQSCSGMPPNSACALTCSDSCTQGQTSCISGLLATCTLGSNGCWAYGAGTACGAHQSCTGSTGLAACTCNSDPTCTAVGNVCASATTLATCAKDAQNCIYTSTSSTCTSGGCSAGACCATGYQQACNSPHGCNSGTYQCNGSCSAAADPANYGTACSSPDGCHTGMYTCSGCSAAADPANYGTACSSPDGCHTGMYTCSGCNAAADPANYGMACSSPDGCHTGVYTCSGCNAAADPANYGTACSSPDGCHTGVYTCSGCNAAADPANYADACGCGGAIQCNGNCSIPETQHSNGVGGSYYDCNPVGTYSAQTASEACASVTGNLASCQGCTDNCGQGGPGSCLDITFNGTLYEWFYGSPSTPGTIFIYTTTGTNACFTNGTYGNQSTGTWD
jgi:hypothetical protein